MMATSVRIDLPGLVWINSLDEDNDDAEVELADGSVTTEVTDSDEVAIHFTLEGESQSLVSTYMTRDHASVLGALLLRESTKPFSLG